jgi:hypothetical protein
VPRSDGAIQVEGLAQFRRSLKELDKNAPKALRIAFNNSAEVIVDEARPKVPVGPTGRARNAIKLRSTQAEARIAGGSKKVPYYPWLDFGGKAGRGRKMVRPFLKHGRYIYDAYFRRRDDFQANLSDELNAVVRQSGMDVD